MSQSGLTAADTGEFEPRVNIVDRATGGVTPVRKDALTGLDEFLGSWRPNVDLPHSYMLSGWQLSDDQHIAGHGKPGYRIVHKTIRTFVVPQVSLSHPNIQINFSNGPVTSGEPRFSEALRGRAAGSFTLPEWGTVEISGDEGVYRWQPNVQMNMESHQEATPDTNYLEILYVLPEGEWVGYDDMVTAGRAGIAALTMMLDFLYGERLLGPVLTEEVGEVFDDWHWNRLIGGRALSTESQARLEMIDGGIFASRIEAAIASHLDRDEEERNRIKVAAQWYWKADAESEPVQRYIAYWLCIEALELGQNDKLWKVKDAVAALMQMDRSDVTKSINSIYRIRNGLVHGSIRDATRENVEQVRAIAVALLESHSLGALTPLTDDGLRWAVGLDR